MTKFHSVFFRFLKAFVSGALATILIASFTTPTTWTEIGTALNMIAISALWGGVTGVIMAGQKWYSWKN